VIGHKITIGMATLHCNGNQIKNYSLSKEHNFRVDRQVIKLEFSVFQKQFVYLQLARVVLNEANFGLIRLFLLSLSAS